MRRKTKLEFRWVWIVLVIAGFWLLYKFLFVSFWNDKIVNFRSTEIEWSRAVHPEGKFSFEYPAGFRAISSVAENGEFKNFFYFVEIYDPCVERQKRKFPNSRQQTLNYECSLFVISTLILNPEQFIGSLSDSLREEGESEYIKSYVDIQGRQWAVADDFGGSSRRVEIRVGELQYLVEFISSDLSWNEYKSAFFDTDLKPDEIKEIVYRHIMDSWEFE